MAFCRADLSRLNSSYRAKEGTKPAAKQCSGFVLLAAVAPYDCRESFFFSVGIESEETTTEGACRHARSEKGGAGTTVARRAPLLLPAVEIGNRPGCWPAGSQDRTGTPPVAPCPHYSNLPSRAKDVDRGHVVHCTGRFRPLFGPDRATVRVRGGQAGPGKRPRPIGSRSSRRR
jgi:hypothetical protein